MIAMEDLKKLEDSQIISVKIDSSLSELHLIIEDDEAIETIIECREIIFCKYSRSYADGGPGFYIFKISHYDSQDKISDYLKKRYGFKDKNKSPKIDSNLKLKWLKIEGDVCIDIVCEDIRRYSQN